MNSALGKEVLMRLRKVSSHVSLRNTRRLTWAETFRFVLTFCLSKEQWSLCYDSVVFFYNKMDCMDSLLCDDLSTIMHSEDTLSPLLPELGSYSIIQKYNIYK